EHAGVTSSQPLNDLLNDAHHSRSHLITTGRLDSLLGDLDSFIRCVDAVWDHCQSSKFASSAEFMQRRTTTPRPASPPSHSIPTKPVQVLTAVAAAEAETIVEEANDTGEQFTWKQIGPIAVYQVLAASLGLAAPRNCRVLVSLEERDIPNHSLVIACCGERLLARRVVQVPDQPALVTLNSEELDPRRRAPMAIELLENIRLLPIVGVIWENQLPRVRQSGEAMLDENFDLANLEVKLAQKVRGRSAEPAVLDGQTILLGPEITWSSIRDYVDQPVSVELEDDTQFLKVVSNTTMGPKGTVRMLSPLGGLGESKLVRGELPAKSSEFASLPQVRRTHRMWAVLYESAFFGSSNP
ncbi:MAG TPA: hypothetical protein VM165_18505, partial [Planctomycetaceae bacterium]|nr:hypothetical protein [Planctomycetaceae bacterium]